MADDKMTIQSLAKDIAELTGADGSTLAALPRIARIRAFDGARWAVGEAVPGQSYMMVFAIFQENSEFMIYAIPTGPGPKDEPTPPTRYMLNKLSAAQSAESMPLSTFKEVVADELDALLDEYSPSETESDDEPATVAPAIAAPQPHPNDVV